MLHSFGTLDHALISLPPPPPPHVIIDYMTGGIVKGALVMRSYLFNKHATQKKLYSNPMVFYCRPSVTDGGPALNQHWINESCYIFRRWDANNVPIIARQNAHTYIVTQSYCVVQIRKVAKAPSYWYASQSTLSRVLFIVIGVTDLCFWKHKYIHHV